jgi:uncharacterized membrane protein YoaT (DUF817 family)
MYASVVSCMRQAWRLLDIELEVYPSYPLSVPLSAGIYSNFCTHHLVPDFRWVLAFGVIVVFFRTRALFTVTRGRRSMPLVLSSVSDGFFVWIAENLSTYPGLWSYPGQQLQLWGWEAVSLHKIGSWCLLVVVSFVIVADPKRARVGLRKG